MKNRYNPVLLAVILVGLCCALWLNWSRHEVEQQNKTVEMAMEYEGLRKLAALRGLPEQDVLQQFKAAGINSLMIFDTTLERLTKNGELLTATGDELRQAATLGADKGAFAAVPAAAVEKNAAYIAASAAAPEVLADVEEDLRLRYGDGRVSVVSESPRILKLNGSTEPVPDGKYDEPLGLLQAPLGLPVRDLRRVADLGFEIIVRPQNYIEVSEAQIDAIFARIDKAGVPVHALMPCGTEVVGFPNRMNYLGQKLEERQMMLVLLEHYTQLRFANIDGTLPLAEFANYRIARSYVIDALEQKKLTVGDALRRWALTDEERNIRVNYIRPFLLPKNGEDILKTNLRYVQNIKADVESRGYTIGKAGVFSAAEADYAPYFPSKLCYVPVLLAIIAGFVLYLALLFELSAQRQLALWAVCSLGALVLLFIGRGLLTRQLLALAAAAVFPVLSMSVLFNIWDRNTTAEHSLIAICLKGVWQLALAIALSLVGAAFLSAILADSRFLLEIDIYRGVKLTFMLPVLLTAVLFIKRYDLLEAAGKGLGTLWQRVSSLLGTPISFRHATVLLVLLFVLYYFVGRSGHTGGVPVPAIELKMRALLEQLMYARPREKEFMIGHPAFFLLVLAVYRCAPRWCQFVLACAAVIGQGSLVQTFCHMRTPVVMSLVRAIDGYAVGAVFGIIAVLVLGLALPLLCKFKRRYLEQ